MSAIQSSLHSGFGATTTATEALAGRDLSGLTAIVTGGYSGLGLETARVLALAGAEVLVPARDMRKAAAALEGVGRAEAGQLDLMDPASIDAYAERFLASGRALHILVNSAGIMAAPLLRDARGYESQFATNHLGHFQLTARLWPALRRAGGARVVSVSSGGHRIAPVDFEDPHFAHRAYDKWQAYGQSKSANALFAAGLDARAAAHGVRAFSLNPGAVFTQLQRHLETDDYRSFGVLDDEGRVKSTEQAGFKTVEQGAATSVWCATSGQLDGMGGLYCEDCDVAELVAPGASGGGVCQWAVDTVLADRLWRLSEQLCGLTFDVGAGG